MRKILMGRPKGMPLGVPFGADNTQSKKPSALVLGATWSVTDRDFANFGFSGDRLLVTSIFDTIGKIIVSHTTIETQTAGKFYVEIKPEFSSVCKVGLIDQLDNEGNNDLFMAQNGTVVFSSGDVIAIALDALNEIAWFKNVTQAGNWNNSGAADPAAGTGGITGFNVIGGPMLSQAAGESGELGTKFTLNTGPTFLGTKPSGFADWYTAL